MGKLTKNANCILMLAVLVCSVLLPASFHFDDDLLFSPTSVDLADHAHPLKAISRNDNMNVARAQVDALPFTMGNVPTVPAPVVQAAPAADQIAEAPPLRAAAISLPLLS